MVLLVVGCLITALGVWRFQSGSIHPDAVAVDGVVAEISTISSATRSGKKLHAPVVEFRHPVTGAVDTVQAQSHSSNPPDVGDQITVMYDPSTGTAIIPQSLLQRIGLVLFGVVVAVLGLVSLLGLV